MGKIFSLFLYRESEMSEASIEKSWNQQELSKKTKDFTHFLQHTKVTAARPANTNGMMMTANSAALESASASARKSISDIMIS